MKLWLKRGIRSLVVLVGIVVLTSFTIDATDSLSNSQTALSLLAGKFTESDCPANMIRLDMGERALCVDQYENSFSESCPNQQPRSAVETQKNVNESDCVTNSSSELTPAVFVTFHQAQNFCARRGGRLPTAYEWYDAALGTPDSNECNVNGGLAKTGSFQDCTSARGAYDMIGNAWEWIDAEIVNGNYNEVALPGNGFVTEADRAGVALRTESNSNGLFNDDYFWSDSEGSFVMMRGGYYNSGEDGGVYSIHADIEPTFTSGAVGFRCVKDI